MNDPNEKQRPAAPGPKKRPRKGASVFVYLAVLFAAAFLMLLLAFFIQQRDNAVAGQHTGAAAATVSAYENTTLFPAAGRAI